MDPSASPDTFPTKSLTTRSIDFWMLGGASLVFWVLMFALDGRGRETWAVNHHFGNLAALSASMALVCNYPHFMASYRLAYSQGGSFVLKNWFQLILVPVGLVAALCWAYMFYLEPSGGSFEWLNQALSAVGLDTTIGLAPTSGQELMNLLLNLMYFTVGWHYAKQVYGCMRVYASYDGYRLTPAQWQLIKVFLFTIWGCSFVHANVGDASRTLQKVTYYSVGLPAWCDVAMFSVFLYLLCSVGVLLWGVYRVTGQKPSINMLIAPIAFVFWWSPPLVQVDFYLLVVPFFHSLQYLGFVYKIERNQLQDAHPSSGGLRGGLIVLALCIAGFLSFELIPNAADNLFDTHERLQAWFFFASAVIFINVHHYFIDNVLWRFSNPRIRDSLLAR